MSITEIVFLAEAALSGVALIAGFVALKRGKKTKVVKSLLEVAEIANEKAGKTFEKVCKKNGVDTNEAYKELTKGE